MLSLDEVRPHEAVNARRLFVTVLLALVLAQGGVCLFAWWNGL